jgi:hypothetical protein
MRLEARLRAFGAFARAKVVLAGRFGGRGDEAPARPIAPKSADVGIGQKSKAEVMPFLFHVRSPSRSGRGMTELGRRLRDKTG